MCWRLSFCLSILAFSACDSLPPLPSESGERVPAEVRFTGLTIAEGFEGAGEAVNNDQILAGTAVQAGATVLAQDGQPLAGALVQFGLKTERWREVFKLPQGASCVTNDGGTCLIILSNEGPAGPVELEIKVPGLAPLFEQLVVVPDASQAQVQIEVSGLGSFDWETGQVVDPLAGEDTLMVLDRDQASGNLVQVRLRDQYGNALPGRSVRLAVLQDGEEPPAAPDAGPASDAGAVASDAGVAADTGAIDSGSSDSGAADTGALVDAGTADAGAAGDAGMKPLTLEQSDRRAKVGAPSESGSCPSDGLSAAQTELVSNADGVALFCLLPGDELGRWTLSVDPGGLFAVAESTTMALAGETKAGTPTRIVLVNPAEPAEGEPAPRIRCVAGEETAYARFRVVDVDGAGVPAVRVRFEALGGLVSVTPRVQVSNAQGEVTVQGICPSRMILGGQIQASLPDADVPPKALGVEVEAGVIERVEITPFGEWPDPIRSGAELSARVVAYDVNGNAVTRAGPVPGLGEPDTRDLLQFRFSMASVGHAEALRLVGSNETLISEVVTVDPELSAAEITLRVSSRATYSNPIQLRAQPVGSEVSDQVSINVAPGDPAHLVVSPAGVVEALLGGAAGELTYTVLDGDGDAANAVPNVPVQITAPQSLVLAANWTNAQTFTGTTGPDGRFRVSVLRANELGDAVVTGTLQTEGGPVNATTTVRVGEGSAARLTMTLNGQALPVEEGLPTLTMRAGTALTQSLAIRVLNNQGAGLANRGLSVDLEQRDPTREGDPSSYDPTFDEQNRVTDETGTITFGQGQLSLIAGGNTGTFVYRLAHGNTPAHARLRIVQIPGPPVIATLTAAEVRSLANNPQSPNEWSDDTSVLVTLQARDANNLAPEGLRMWLNVTNCFVETRAFELDENGEASFRVAGGNQVGQDCSLRPRYFNEVDNYITRAANGRPAGEGETAEQVAARERLLIQTTRFDAPDLQEVGFGNDTSFVLTANGSRRWSVTAQDLLYPNSLEGGDCTPVDECTTAQIVAMERTEAGALQVRLIDGSPQVLRANIPLNYTFRNGFDFDVFVTVRDGWLGAGGWLGIRLKNPEEDDPVSEAKAFYAHPPIQWTGAGEGGHDDLIVLDGQQLGHNNTEIRGGLRANLDNDAADELIVCGTDNQNGWFEIINLHEDGYALSNLVRLTTASWQGGAYTAPIDNRFACVLGDIDNDQIDDLVVLAGSQGGYPSVVLHRGTGSNDTRTMFRVPGERLVWNEDRRLRNLTPRTMQLDLTGAVVVCMDNELECRDRIRLIINFDGQTAQASGFERLNSQAVNRRNVVQVGGGYFVQPNGQVRNQGEAFSWRGHHAAIIAVAIGANGRILASGGNDRTIQLVDPANRRYIRRWTAHDSHVWDLAFSPDGATLVSSSHDSFVRFWDVESGRLLRTVSHTAGVRSVAYSPDGRMVVSAGDDRHIRFWDARTGRALRSIDVGSTVYSVAISPDGSMVASGDGHQYVMAWNATTGDRIWRFNLHDDRIRSVRFSPDGRTLASSADDGTVRLIATHDGSEIRNINPAHGGNLGDDVHNVVFSPDGQLIASAGGDHKVKLWASSDGSLVRTLRGHTDEVVDLSFGADGQTLATGSVDRTLKLWAVEDGGEIWSIEESEYRPHPYAEFEGIGVVFPGQENTQVRVLAAYQDNAIRLRRPYTWRPNCGDGVVDEGELFDNGQPWQGGEYAAQCGATCGDGVVQNGEDCDDANESNADACLNACQANRCGDGIVRQDVQPGEEGYESCDDENDDRFDGCGSDCNRCGDGVIGDDETCDDANEVDQDGCTNCVLDTCGDGQVSDGEQCDDGNDVSEDACVRCLNNCPPNSEVRFRGGELFCFISSPVTWDSAQQLCSGSGKDLVHIENAQTNDWLHQTAQNLGWDPAEFWIGARDDGEMRWVSQDTMSYINWGGGQPNPNAQACVIMMPNSQWADIECDNERKFVCR